MPGAGSMTGPVTSDQCRTIRDLEAIFHGDGMSITRETNGDAIVYTASMVQIFTYHVD
jgi:hypothetical protein